MHSREGLTSLAGSTLSSRSPTFPCTEARQQVGPSSIRIQRSISRSVMRSEKVSLLHNAKELLLVHLAITVAVRLVDHLLKLLIRHALAELLRDALEVLERDLARLVVVEQAERLEDLVLRVAVENLLRHHGHELRELDRAGTVVVHVLDHLLDLLLLRLEAQRTHRDLELLRVNGPRPVRVEEVEGLLDLLLLLLRQLLLLAATAAETPTKRH